MPISIPNPYSGQDDETCSVSFAAQQQMAGGVGSSQTEAEYNQSKLLGEWGVIQAKLKKGEIPDGTKILAYTNATANSRGYLYVQGGKLKGKKYVKGVGKDFAVGKDTGENFIKALAYQVAIPQSVAPNPKPEPVVVKFNDPGYQSKQDFTEGQVVAVNANGQQYVKFENNKFSIWELGLDGVWGSVASFNYLGYAMDDDSTWHKPDGKPSTTNATPAFSVENAPAPKVVAAPVAATPVNSASPSVGSMSHEDVAAMFVKIKDDLAKEQGLNIKGANPALDQVVFDKIGEATGYTGAEVKGKIDAYKAQGNKLSALKKKVLAGTYKVPEGSPAPPKQTGANSPLATPAAKAVAADPKPNGVPTVATPAVANAVKKEVKAEAAAAPAKVYSDEDVAAAYIIAKDNIVATNTKGWTLYTKNDAMDLEIAIAVGLKTGLNPTQQKQAIASYLATGKKLSTLKKQLAKQGAFKPQAETLKKSNAAKTQAEKEAEVTAMADSGYTPTPTPSSAGSPPVETGKPAPKAVVNEAAKAGGISDIPAKTKQQLYVAFKAQGSKSYLTSSNEQTYEALLSTQLTLKTAEGIDLTLLQILRVIDEEGAKKFSAENAKLFEKKTATWLTSPEAAAYLKKQEAALAKQAEQAKAKAEAEKAAKLLEANQPPLPADSAQFRDWDLAYARKVSERWLAKAPHTAKQKAGLRHYTGSAYVAMNSYLRGLNTNISAVDKSHIEPAKQGMRPTDEPILVKRGTGANQFQTLGVQRGDTSLLWGITGKTFKDEGFLSTSAGGRAAFGGECLLEIECPVGTPMMYVDPFSKHPGENEMLLQAGLEYKILNVRKEGNKFVIRCRVVNWPGKVN